MDRKLVFLLPFFFMLIPSQLLAENSSWSLHDLTANRITGEAVPLSIYKGKVVLIANVATRCGTTPQLRELETLYKEYSPKGLVVLGFPSGDFTKEDTTNKKKIDQICTRKYGITFPLFSPGKITGVDKQKVYSFLTAAGEKKTRGEVSFNFEKFLLDKDGRVRYRFGPFTGPESEVLKEDIQELLQEKS